MLTGGCFCGYVRYRVTGTPRDPTNCHCSICRRVSGGPFVAWFTATEHEFAITAGLPASFRSSDHARREFCPRCGSPLTFRSTHAPGSVDVTTCTLDDPEAVPPRDHTHTSSQLSWIRLADGLPRYATARDSANETSC